MENAGGGRSGEQGAPPHQSKVAAKTNKRSWRTELSDAGLFSYAALCGVSLYYLYGDTPSHRLFQKTCLSTLLSELQLAESGQVRTSVMALMDGQGSSDVSVFIDLLRAEPVVERIGLQQVPEDLVSVAIKEGCYDARVRVLTRRLATLLMLDWQEVEEFERSLINQIRGEAHRLSEEEQKEKDSSALKRKVKKYTMIGLATVGGGALLGLTGGLAAPFLAAGAGAIIGGAGAAALGSVAGIAIIGSLFGVAGAGLGGYKMNKRVGDIEEFEFETLCEEGDLHVTIAISGWITDNEPDFKSPWANLSHSRDQFSLKYESEHLKTMGAAMDYMLTFAISAATQETLKYTILSGLLAAVAWPMTLLSASSIIDNPWSVCTHRTAAAGKQLAEVLLAREQGKRPVTLVGFSLGARVVFYCLTELAKRKNSEGIVQDAVMLGAPVTGSSSHWAPFQNVVSGRIVNGYCRGDWLLRFLYRTASVQFSIAGLQPIKWQNRRMCNVDLSHIVTGHLDYWNKIDLILSVVGIRTSADDLVVTAEAATENMEPSDQWLVVSDTRLPSSGIASEVTTPSSSQATDPFPGCSPPAPVGHGSVSTDSGLDRDSELENMCAGTEGLTLGYSEEQRSPYFTKREICHSPRQGHTGRDQSPRLGHTERDQSPRLGHTERDQSPRLGHTERDQSPRLGHTERDQSPRLGHTERDQSPRLGHTERDQSPHLGHTARDQSPRLGHTERDQSPRLGHTERDQSPRLGHTERDQSPRLGHTERDQSPRLGHTERDQSPHLGHTARDQSPRLGHTERDQSPSLGHAERDQSPRLGHTERDQSPHLRHTGRDQSPRLGHTGREQSPHLGHTERDQSPHLGHTRRDQSPHMRYKERDQSPHMRFPDRDQSPRLRDHSPHFEQRNHSPHPRYAERDHPLNPRDQVPHYRDDLPRPRDPSLNLDDQPPHMRGQPPHLQGQPPHLTDEPPFTRDQSPHFRDQPPVLGEQPLHLQNQPPYLQGQPPIPQDYPPLDRDQAPHLEHDPRD